MVSLNYRFTYFCLFGMCSSEFSSSFGIHGSVSSLHFLLFVYLWSVPHSQFRCVFPPREKEHKNTRHLRCLFVCRWSHCSPQVLGGALTQKEGLWNIERITLTDKYCLSRFVIGKRSLALNGLATCAETDAIRFIQYSFLCFMTKVQWLI